MQLLGASAALAGLGACQPPRDKIVPTVRDPKDGLPGRAFHYATALALDGYATGLVVTSHEGRPTKVEGNPAHPASLGASGAFEQAVLLDLYDPLRLEGFRRRGQALAWRTLLAELSKLAASHDADGGARLRFLLAPDASPAPGRPAAPPAGPLPRRPLPLLRAAGRGRCQGGEPHRLRPRPRGAPEARPGAT